MKFIRAIFTFSTLVIFVGLVPIPSAMAEQVEQTTEKVSETISFDLQSPAQLFAAKKSLKPLSLLNIKQRW